jgi:hypothetical protein
MSLGHHMYPCQHKCFRQVHFDAAAALAEQLMERCSTWLILGLFSNLQANVILMCEVLVHRYPEG